MSRLILSQKERDFAGINYNDIKRVFSVWICMNLNENSMSYIHLKKDDMIGSYQWKGNLGLLNIVMIGLSNELPMHDDKYDLHRLLGTLLSKELPADKKLNIIEAEYDIPIEDSMRKDVNMCNLSQGIRDDAIFSIIMNMHKEGYSLEQIARVVERSIDEVKAVIEDKEPALV